MWSVGNSGASPEMYNAAKALAEAGELHAYLAPLLIKAEQREALAKLPSRAARTAASRLERRSVAPVLEDLSVSVANSGELAFKALLAAHAPHAAILKLVNFKNSQFQNAVCRAAGRPAGGAFNRWFLPAYAARKAMSAVHSSNGVVALNYPMAHHRYMQEEFARLLSRSPRWSALWEVDVSTERVLGDLDFELDQADLVVVQSGWQRSTLLRRGVEFERMHLVPLGIDNSFFKVRPHERGQGPLRICFVGQVGERKGFGVLIEAFEGLADLDVVLDVVGPYSPAARSAVGENPRVTWHGARSRDFIRSLYATADLMVLPTRAEGFCLTPAEAMASGVPVVVSSRPHVSSLIENGVSGWVLEEIEAEELHGLLRRIFALSSREREVVGERGRDAVRHLTWELYGDVLRGALSLIVPPRVG